MANRWANQFGKTLEKDVYTIFARVTFGAAGAPTLVTAHSKGIVSVTRNAAGKFTFVFGQLNATNGNILDTYNALLGFDVNWDESGAGAPSTPSAPFFFLLANSTGTVGTASLQLELNAVQGGAATDPSSGEAAYFRFYFTNSSAY